MKRAFISSFAFIAAVLFSASSTFAQDAVMQPTREPARPRAVVFQAAGTNAASLQSSIDQYRVALGGVNNGNTPGPIATGRREINWDGGGSTATSLAGNPFDGFLNSRGSRFITPGTGFVQATAAGLADVFVNAGYTTKFQPFSNARLFSAIGSNQTDVLFFQPGGGEIPAGTRGFGAVFSDVDLPDGSGPATKNGNRFSSTLVVYYDVYDNELYSGFVPASPGEASLSFIGIVVDDPVIARVKIVSGNTTPGSDEDGRTDIVVMDDFLFGEPSRSNSCRPILSEHMSVRLVPLCGSIRTTLTMSGE